MRYVDAMRVDPGRLRIGIATTLPSGAAVHPDCVAATHDIAGVLTDLGHDVGDEAPDFPFEEIMSGLQYLMAVPVAVDVKARLAALGRDVRDDDLEPMTRIIYDGADQDSAGDYVRALRDLETAATTLGGYFAHHDLLLTPTLGTLVAPLGLLDTTDPASLWQHAMSFSGMTSPFNVTGQPAISLPLGTDSAGMPVGIQLVAAFGREDLLLQVAAQLEQARPWRTAPVWPPVDRPSDDPL